MTTHKTNLPLVGFGLMLVVVYGLAVFVAGALPRVQRPGLVAAALTLDLTVFVPLLYYALLVRRKGWPAVTVAPVFLLSLLAASMVVPAAHQDVLRLLKFLAAPAELLLLGVLGLTMVRTARRVRAHTASGEDDALAALRASLRETLGARWAADVLAFEVGLLYYALFSWRTPTAPARPPFAFSYHRRCGYGSILAGILVALLIELIALHLLVRLWNPTVAWVLTALSAYGILWLVGDFQAIRRRPMLIEKDALLVRIGLRWTVRVPFAAIATVRPAGKKPTAQRRRGHLDAVLWGAPRYRVELKEPLVAQGLYGMRKSITTLGLAPDDAAAFEAALMQRFADWQQGAG